MSSTSQLTTFSDLYVDLQNRVRVQTSVSATETQAKRYVNIALHDMHVGYAEKLPWCHREGILITQPQYTTGTVSITKGSTTLTGSSTVWTTSNDFGVANARTTGKIVIDGSIEPYGISAVGGAGSITLSSRFTETTVSSGDYVYFEDEYDLASDFLRPLNYTSFDTNGTIDLIGWNEFRHRYPRNKIPGKPTVAAILDKGFSGSTTPVRRVVFHAPPDQAYTIRYDYVTANLAVSAAGVEAANLSADTDEPIVPLRYRHAIIYGALYHWYRDKKDDARSQEAKAEYTDLVLRMVSDTEVGRARPQIRPRIGPYRAYARSPYTSGRSGRWSAGTRFDEVR